MSGLQFIPILRLNIILLRINWYLSDLMVKQKRNSEEKIY